MLCDGDGPAYEIDTTRPTNAEIASAFSPSDSLSLHCVINTACRELFVAAASCRDAKIIAVYLGHLQGVGCGACSKKDMKRFTEPMPPEFIDELKVALSNGEPGPVWHAGYWSEKRDRAAKERRDAMMLRGPG